jgi:2-keto-3-deoxy-L-rhamnonate aldolase RhmA
MEISNSKKNSNFKDIIKSSRLNGYWSVLPLPQIHETFGIAGFDFSIVDIEHGSFSFQDALESIIAIKSSGMYALIRPSSHDPKEILRCLELGVDGICVPHVQNFEQARNIVQSCLYPPLGKRGASGFTRATSYGNTNFSKHKISENEKLFISLLIEDKNGIENLKEITSVEGLNSIYFGTYDIANSYGFNDQSGTEVNNIVSEAIDKLSDHDISFGQVAVDSNQYKKLDKRINFIPCGVDCGIVLSGAKNLILDIKS